VVGWERDVGDRKVWGTVMVMLKILSLFLLYEFHDSMDCEVKIESSLFIFVQLTTACLPPRSVHCLKMT
jgi:hypothetical protein